MQIILSIIVIAWMFMALVVVHDLAQKVDDLATELRRHPPAKDVGELTMTLTCDSTQFNEQMDVAIEKLQVLKEAKEAVDGRR